MKLSLRKASALQSSINDAIKGIALETTVSINEFQDAEATIATKRIELSTNVQRQIALTKALYAIRMAVGAANASSGVDNALAEMALVDKTIRIYTQLSGVAERTDPTVVAGKLDKIRNRKEESNRSYLFEAEVATTVFEKSDIVDIKTKLAEAKKAKQKLQDKLLELNVRNEIELSQEVVDVLNKENLL